MRQYTKHVTVTLNYLRQLGYFLSQSVGWLVCQLNYTKS